MAKSTKTNDADGFDAIRAHMCRPNQMADYHRAKGKKAKKPKASASIGAMMK